MIDLTVSSQLPRRPCSFSSKDSEFLPETPRSTTRGQTGRGRSQNSEEGWDGCLLCQKVKNGSSSELCQATGENLEIYEGGLRLPGCKSPQNPPLACPFLVMLIAASLRKPGCLNQIQTLQILQSPCRKQAKSCLYLEAD